MEILFLAHIVYYGFKCLPHGCCLYILFLLISASCIFIFSMDMEVYICINHYLLVFFYISFD